MNPHALIATLMILTAVSACRATPARLTAAARAVRDSVSSDIVIAHRGVPYWAPEETRPAYELARELGADYLEADLQRTRDGVLICLHDDDLRRTSNVGDRFPERATQPASAFTLAELRSLDAGTWFNRAYPDRARPSYVGLKILTLDELLDIAETGTNQPGVYLETKKTERYPGIERDLAELLTRRGWLARDRTGSNGQPLVILQTFERSSLRRLVRHFPHVPKLLLLWHDGDSVESIDPATMDAWLDFAVENGAHFIGPSFPGEEGDANERYGNLLQGWIVEEVRARGLGLHAYTFRTAGEIRRYASRCDGQFTDRADLLLDHYGRQRQPVPDILEQLAY